MRKASSAVGTSAVGGGLVGWSEGESSAGMAVRAVVGAGPLVGSPGEPDAPATAPLPLGLGLPVGGPCGRTDQMAAMRTIRTTPSPTATAGPASSRPPWSPAAGERRGSRSRRRSVIRAPSADSLRPHKKPALSSRAGLLDWDGGQPVTDCSQFGPGYLHHA